MNEPLDPPLYQRTAYDDLCDAKKQIASLRKRCAAFARWKMEELARQGRDAEAAKVEKELKLLER